MKPPAGTVMRLVSLSRTPPDALAGKPVAIVVAVKVERGSLGYDQGRVDRWVRVVADLDVLQVHRLPDAGPLVEFAQVVRELRVVVDAPKIALEGAVVGCIE